MKIGLHNAVCRKMSADVDNAHCEATRKGGDEVKEQQIWTTSNCFSLKFFHQYPNIYNSLVPSDWYTTHSQITSQLEEKKIFKKVSKIIYCLIGKINIYHA